MLHIYWGPFARKKWIFTFSGLSSSRNCPVIIVWLVCVARLTPPLWWPLVLLLGPPSSPSLPPTPSFSQPKSFITLLFSAIQRVEEGAFHIHWGTDLLSLPPAWQGFQVLLSSLTWRPHMAQPTHYPSRDMEHEQDSGAGDIVFSTQNISEVSDWFQCFVNTCKTSMSCQVSDRLLLLSPSLTRQNVSDWRMLYHG